MTHGNFTSASRLLAFRKVITSAELRTVVDTRISLDPLRSPARDAQSVHLEQPSNPTPLLIVDGAHEPEVATTALLPIVRGQQRCERILFEKRSCKEP